MGRHVAAASEVARAKVRARPALATSLAAALLLGLLSTAPAADAAVGEPTTYDGPSYHSSVNRPSENKPQSKLWYVDGSWWALMVTGNGNTTVRIHELMPDHSWRDTGTVVDTRLNSTGDALWSAVDDKLYVASRTDGSNLQIARFSYNNAADAWSRDSGYPLAVQTGDDGSESATIDQDSTGRLWVTYTQGSRLWVTHSDVNGQNWVPGFQPNVGDVTIKSDDISALIAFDNSIGLLWSDQQSGAFRFAIHEDDDPTSQWRVEDAGASIPGGSVADDHVNLKQLSGDVQGRIFAAVKTSNDLEGPDAPLVGVLARTPGPNGVGTWEFVVAGTVADDHTRPIIVIDETNQELYFLATAPVQGGDIYYKKTSLADPSFGPGRGDKFVDSSRSVNNASGSKQPVNAATGMVVLAVAEGVKRYVHAELALGGGGEPPATDTTAPSVPQDLQGSVVAGGVDLSWSSSVDDVGVAGYTVIRDEAFLADTGSGATSYADSGVEAGRTYVYTVEAFDAVGNRSAPSGPVSVDVPAGSPPPPAGDGIALRGVSTATNDDGEDTLTIPVPNHQPGDLLLATVNFRGSPDLSTPAGWNLLRRDENGTAVRMVTYWRVAGSSEPASYTWTFERRPPAVGSILAYSGVSTPDPIEASSGQANPRSSMVTAPSVTTQSPGAFVVGLFAVNKDAEISPPTGMTERSEVSSPGTEQYPVTGETADVEQATAGASGDKVATSTVNAPSIGQLVALRPA